MAAIKLYDFASSPNCQRVKVVLAEKKLPYETIPVDLKKGEQKKAEYLKLNPYGKVPVVIDGATVLYESLIINEYLDEKYPSPPLMPKDAYLRGRARVLVDYALNYMHEPYWALRGEMLKPAGKRDETIIGEKHHSLRELLQYLESALGNQPYFLGDLSLTDIAIVPRALRMEAYGALPTPSLPRLSAWLERMKARSSVRAIL